jgi:hypothetical protein
MGMPVRGFNIPFRVCCFCATVRLIYLSGKRRYGLSMIGSDKTVLEGQPVWKVEENHVYPVNDLREHTVAECWCNPVDDDGIMVHNSLDGREMYEREERRKS